jgi:hypothetical protein
MFLRFAAILLVTLGAAGQTPVASGPSERWGKLDFGITAPGSPYIPLDSWVYPAFERLIAGGYVDSAYLGLRPWTRLSAVRLIAQAQKALGESTADREARLIVRDLRAEFEADYQAATADRPRFHMQVDSLYERSLGIIGTPLNDSFHFGQTLINDYGRPYEKGFSQIAGFSGHAGWGRLSLVVRGEYQHAPSRPAYSESVRDAIAMMDSNPVAPPTPVAGVDTFRLIDANLSVNLLNHEISVGKSEMWWGPAEGGAFAYSNNAEPIYMFRINRVEPLMIPLLSKLLGPVRYDLFLGSLKGHGSPFGPWIQGQKVSFRPSPNLEFGVSRTIVFAGKGHVPLTFGSFWNSFSSFDNVPIDQKFSALDPGARYSTFDFSYRLPYLRDWLTLYTDAMAHDDPSPISAPRRAAFRPGIYLSHFPGFSRLDFRAEASYTDFPTSRSQGGKFFFFENAYHDAYTNKQFILGDWVGREGKGLQGWLTYHLSPKEMLQAGYRYAKSASDFVPGGTTQNDASLRLVHRLGDTVELNALAQIEFWKAPLLAQGLRTDVALELQLTYFPKLSWKTK